MKVPRFICLLLIATVTGNVCGQITRTEALTIAVRAGLTPEALSPFSVTGPEYVALLGDVLASPGTLTSLQSARSSLDAAIKTERDAFARCKAAPEDTALADALVSAQTSTSTARAQYEATRDTALQGLIANRITDPELTTYLASLPGRTETPGSPLIPWSLLSPAQRSELTASVEKLKSRSLNPNDIDTVGEVRDQITNYGGAVLAEFDQRLSRFQELASYAGQWLAGG